MHPPNSANQGPTTQTVHSRLPHLSISRIAACSAPLVQPFAFACTATQSPPRLFCIVDAQAHWFYRYVLFASNRGTGKAPYREYFVMHTWFMIALPVWRFLHATLRSLGLRSLLPGLCILCHFGCWGNNCRWPFLRHPHEFEESFAAYGYFGGSRTSKAFAAVLPQNDL